MAAPLPDLPVKDILPQLLAGLAARPNAVLVAPPGAGKTTLVPLALLGEAWARSGRILLLEPRRLAARAAARRMASLLGEEVGATIGYAMRMESRQSAKTRVLVVTEGILARMILDEPDLPGVAAILFDEFHERSLDGDFGLALALDVQGGLRPDLRLVVMSATLDGARVADLLGEATLLKSEGRSFPGRYPLRGAARDRRGRRRRRRGGPRRAGGGKRQRACLPARPARDRAHRRAAAGPGRRRHRYRAALRQSRRQGAGRRHPPVAARTPQGGAGDVDRRNLDHHRRRARGGRLRAVAIAEIRAGNRHHAARDGARVACVRRPAGGARRPHAARRGDQAVARRADRGAAGLRAAGDPRSRPVRHAARLRRVRRCRSVEAFLPRSAAAAGAQRGTHAVAGARRDRRRGPHHRRRTGDAAAGSAGAAGAYGQRSRDVRPGARRRRCWRC